MAGCVPAGFNQGESGQKLGISTYQPVAQCRVVKVGSCLGKARVAAPCHSVLLTLGNELGLRKGVVVSGMVDVEVTAYDRVDIFGSQTQIGKMRQHGFFLLWLRRTWWCGVIWGESAVNEDIFPISSLHQVAARRQVQSLPRWQWYCRSRQ